MCVLCFSSQLVAVHDFVKITLKSSSMKSTNPSIRSRYEIIHNEITWSDFSLKSAALIIQLAGTEITANMYEFIMKSHNIQITISVRSRHTRQQHTRRHRQCTTDESGNAVAETETTVHTTRLPTHRTTQGPCSFLRVHDDSLGFG